MAGFILNFESRMLMLEVLVHQLCIPSSCPFDKVISSKYVVSFSFLDGEWIDILPQRSDYRPYCGSTGQQQSFNGGKSVVLALPASSFCDEVKGLTVEFAVRREVSKYFEIESNIIELGKLSVNVDELFNYIVQELTTRRELIDYLKVPHEKDPICKSMRRTYQLKDVDTDEATDSKIELWLRLSHLGNNLITEIDRPGSQDTGYFYAQEQSNREKAYELKELGCFDPPSSKVPLWSRIKECAELECSCSDEQRNRGISEGIRSVGVSTLVSLETCSSSEGSVKSRGHEKSVGTGDEKHDQGTGTGADTDTGTGTGKQGKNGRGAGDGDEEDSWTKVDRTRKRRRGTGSGATSGWVDKNVPCEPCEPCCLPCDPCVYTASCTPCTSYFTSFCP